MLTSGPVTSEHVVLFAAGAGGDPERHRPLLEHLSAHGCYVVAPCFERLMVPTATAADYVARPVGLVEALRRSPVSEGAVITVVGHSIGGWAALCLAGATPWGRDGLPLDVPRESRVGRLVLYAPAAGWFAALGALDAVTAPMLVFAGEQDAVVPVEQVRLLEQGPGAVDVRVVPGADHFSFMNSRPPGTADPAGFDRETFLRQLAQDTLDFVLEP